MTRAGRFLVYPFALCFAAMPLAACGPNPDEPNAGYLEIRYRLNELEDPEPSYQTVIWLEKENGEYLKSLLVSEYLAYGGYEKPEICSDWSRAADWGNVPEAVFDAVTGATPPVEENTIRVDCEKEGLLPGVYRYCVQTHIVEAYNILYRGRIEIGGSERESRAKAVHSSDGYPEARNVLSDVEARYYK